MVAHPRWREELLKSAKKLGCVRAEQYLASQVAPGLWAPGFDDNCEGARERKRWRSGWQRLIPWLGLTGLLAYMSWIGAPYIRSVIVRDAAVTTWITYAASPISGHVDRHPLRAGDRVGADGRMLAIDNPRADLVPLASARADLARAKARVIALGERQAAIDQVVEKRARFAAGYAAAFRRDLDIKIEGAAGRLAFAKQRVGLELAEATRMSKLALNGAGSLAAADSATGKVTDHQRVLTEMQTSLDRAILHLRAADQDIILLDDGTEGGTAQRALEDARLEQIRVAADLAAAKAEAEAAQLIVVAALATYEKQRAAIIEAPPGAKVWSLIVGPGVAVERGTQVASWVDCRIMLVDAPVSDVEIGLLRKGARADVVLEGERAVRQGTVIRLRGATATIGVTDLADIAKGRRPGIGQALLRLEPTADDVESCRIGHAAYVDFPDIGLIEILRARLRL